MASRILYLVPSYEWLMSPFKYLVMSFRNYFFPWEDSIVCRNYRSVFLGLLSSLLSLRSFWFSRCLPQSTLTWVESPRRDDDRCGRSQTRGGEYSGSVVARERPRAPQSKTRERHRARPSSRFRARTHCRNALRPVVDACHVPSRRVPATYLLPAPVRE